MSEHTSDTGRSTIGALVALGEALGYAAECEYAVPRSGTTTPTRVDVAWGRRSVATPSRGMVGYPLFVFEVESIASPGMAFNVMKVLALDASEFPRPIYFFHLVLSGGERSSRPVATAEQYRQHNYGIYLIADGATRLLRDIALQHARISSRCDLGAVGWALVEHNWDQWPDTDFAPALEALEGCDPGAALLADYARLIVEFGGPAFTARYAAAAERQLADRSRHHGYEGFFADQQRIQLTTLLNLAILASLQPADAETHFDSLRRWQRQSRPGALAELDEDSIPMSTTYLDFFFGPLAYLWAMVAALTDHLDGAPAWVLQQLRLVMMVSHGPPIDRTSYRHIEFAGPAALWALHVCANENGLVSAYEDIRAFVNRSGGLPRALILRPPRFGAAYKPGTEIEVPPAAELTRWVREELPAPPRSPVTPVLFELLYGGDNGRDIASDLIVSWLARERTRTDLDRARPETIWRAKP